MCTTHLQHNNGSQRLVLPINYSQYVKNIISSLAIQVNEKRRHRRCKVHGVKSFSLV